jgi:hypothetical protein
LHLAEPIFCIPGVCPAGVAGEVAICVIGVDFLMGWKPEVTGLAFGGKIGSVEAGCCAGGFYLEAPPVLVGMGGALRVGDVGFGDELAMVGCAGEDLFGSGLTGG